MPKKKEKKLQHAQSFTTHCLGSSNQALIHTGIFKLEHGKAKDLSRPFKYQVQAIIFNLAYRHC